MSDVETEFLEITGASDSEIASYYLELSDGNIHAAVELYFDDNRPAKSSFTTLLSDNTSSELASVVPTAKPSNEMLVLLWNIQGLLSTRIRERTVETAKEIKRYQPDVIMLQEVIFDSLDYFRSTFEDYECFCPSDFSNDQRVYAFFNALLVRRKTFVVESKKLVNFGASLEERDYIIVTGRCCEQNVTLITSHLDATKAAASIRIPQFIKICEAMKREPLSQTVMFGGDMNLRDSDVTEAKKKSDVVAKDIEDVWEKLGSPAETKYTWDCQRNDNQDFKTSRARFRFDRIYMRKEDPAKKIHFKPASMKFIGTKRLPCGLFPSDHWGVLATMKLPEEKD